MTKFEKDHDLGIESRIGSGNTCCSSECCMYWAIELTVFLSFCVGVKFGVLDQEKNTHWRFVRAGGEGSIWCEREVGIEGCRRLCSELHVCYCSPDIINVIVERKIMHNVACSMHILKKEGVQTFVRKPEKEERLWRLWRIMWKSVFERNRTGGGIGLFLLGSW